MRRLFLPRASQGKRTIGWTLAFFVAAQPALWFYLEWRHPDLRDGLYTLRLRSLQARQAESPGAPLILALGSSRTKYGLSPAAMKLRPSPGVPQPLIYNFGINGLGSIRELMYFRRLLADGIRPDWLLLETWPPQWAQEGFFEEGHLLVEIDDVHCRDVSLVGRYYWRKPWVLTQELLRCLVPIQTYRSSLLFAVSPWLLPRQLIEEKTRNFWDWQPADRAGWFPLTWGAKTPRDMERALHRGVEQMKPLVESLRIDPRGDHALRALLAECGAHGIKVALFMMPEHSAARGWYSAQSRAQVQSYLDGLCHDFNVWVIDTRDWLPDSAFTDFCHIWSSAAGPYSERFGREVLQPLLDGKAPGSAVSPQENAAAQ